MGLSIGPRVLEIIPLDMDYWPHDIAEDAGEILILWMITRAIDDKGYI